MSPLLWTGLITFGGSIVAAFGVAHKWYQIKQIREEIKRLDPVEGAEGWRPSRREIESVIASSSAAAESSTGMLRTKSGIVKIAILCGLFVVIYGSSYIVGQLRLNRMQQAIEHFEKSSAVSKEIESQLRAEYDSLKAEYDSTRVSLDRQRSICDEFEKLLSEERKSHELQRKAYEVLKHTLLRMAPVPEKMEEKKRVDD